MTPGQAKTRRIRLALTEALRAAVARGEPIWCMGPETDGDEGIHSPWLAVPVGPMPSVSSAFYDGVERGWDGSRRPALGRSGGARAGYQVGARLKKLFQPAKSRWEAAIRAQNAQKDQSARKGNV